MPNKFAGGMNCRRMRAASKFVSKIIIFIKIIIFQPGGAAVINRNELAKTNRIFAKNIFDESMLIKCIKLCSLLLFFTPLNIFRSCCLFG
jgi:hypothetical protein